MRWLIAVVLAGCVSFTAPDAPAAAEEVKLRGDLHLQERGITATFVGMVGIEGDFDPQGLELGDHPVIALGRPWFEGMTGADPVVDGRLPTWTSAYVEGSTYHGLVLPSNNDGVGHLSIGGAGDSDHALGILRDCAAHASLWRIGSVQALQIAETDPAFATAPGDTLMALWMGPQVLGCGELGKPFWWIVRAPLGDAFLPEAPIMARTAIVDATDGTATFQDEPLRLRPALERVLFEDAYTPALDGGSQDLGEVGLMAERLEVDVLGGTLPIGYSTTLVGPSEEFPFTDAINVEAPEPGTWSVRFSPTGPAGAPGEVQLRAAVWQ